MFTLHCCYWGMLLIRLDFLMEFLLAPCVYIFFHRPMFTNVIISFNIFVLIIDQ